MGEGQAAAGPEATRVVTGRFPLASPRTAMVLGALAVVLTALSVVLRSALSDRDPRGRRAEFLQCD